MRDKDTALQLAFVGDIALGNHPKAPGFGFYSRYRKEIPGNLGSRLLPPTIRPDLFFGNLEFALASDSDHPGNETCCLGVINYIPFLKQAGLTVLNVANNHAWEHEREAFWTTVRSLQAAGIKVVGIPDDFEPADFLRIKGKIVAFLGCSARPRQGFSAQPGYNEFDGNHFLGRIREARRHADLVCVSIHWGEEFIVIPSEEEKDLARAMLEAGAAVVVGHHPHVLREIETCREGVIAYSLGNFIGDMSWNPVTLQTGCLLVEAEGGRIRGQSFFPAVIEKDFFPRYLDRIESQRFLAEQTENRLRLQRKLPDSGYELFARKALRKNQWLTMGFLLQNLFRYKIAILWQILAHGIRVRLLKDR